MKFVALFLFAGCIAQMQNAVAPPPSQATGTLTCSQIVATCDSACTDPICVHNCTQQGTPEGAQLHANVVACAESHGCTEEACVRASCGAEADACEGPPQPPQQPPQ